MVAPVWQGYMPVWLMVIYAAILPPAPPMRQGGPAEVTTSSIDQVIWHVDMNVVDDANPPVTERYKMSNLWGTEAGETVY